MKGGDTILKKKQIVMAFVVALFVVGTVGVQAASAKTTTNNTTNTTNNDRPGWGNGDDNHHHKGPPGHSVRPGDGDNDDHGKDKDKDKGHKISSAELSAFFAHIQQEIHAFFLHFS